MEARDEGRKRLAEAMNRRRAELRTTWDEVARRGGISVATLRRARNGSDELTLDTIVAIERGMEWEQGHVEALVAGRDPVTRRNEHSPPAGPPPGWGIDPREWALYDPVDREMILNAISIAKQRVAAPSPPANHPIERRHSRKT